MYIAMELGCKPLRQWIEKRNRQGRIGDEVNDRRLIYRWYKDICEVTKYLQTIGISNLMMDELTSDNIFLTQENRVKVSVLECVINATLRSRHSTARTDVALSMDSSKGMFRPQLNTYPLGM